jgi:hypothetical protein
MRALLKPYGTIHYIFDLTPEFFIKNPEVAELLAMSMRGIHKAVRAPVSRGFRVIVGSYTQSPSLGAGLLSTSTRTHRSPGSSTWMDEASESAVLRKLMLEI